jgi:hypothetical protein
VAFGSVNVKIAIVREHIQAVGDTGRGQVIATGGGIDYQMAIDI